MRFNIGQHPLLLLFISIKLGVEISHNVSTIIKRWSVIIFETFPKLFAMVINRLCPRGARRLHRYELMRLVKQISEGRRKAMPSPADNPELYR